MALVMTEIEIDDQLLADVMEYTDITDINALVHEALTALIERHHARNWAEPPAARLTH